MKALGLTSLGRIGLVTLLALSACFASPSPDVTTMVCASNKNCPIGYECVLPNVAGGCKRAGVDASSVGDDGANQRDTPALGPGTGGTAGAPTGGSASGGGIGPGGTTAPGGAIALGGIVAAGGATGSGGAIATGGRGGDGGTSTAADAAASGGTTRAGGAGGASSMNGGAGMVGVGGSSAGSGGSGTGGVVPGTGGMGSLGGSGAGGTPCPGQTMCGVACVDTTKDLHNCGACGRDCKFGSCVASKCVPVLIPTATNVLELAADGTNVYALDASGGNLYGCQLSQCGNGGTMPLLKDGLSSPRTLLPVASAGSVFVSQSANGSMVLNLSPSGVVKSTISPAPAAASFGLATDGNNLYIGTMDLPTGILKTALAGTATPTTAFANGGFQLYFDPVSNAIFVWGGNKVDKCPLGGTTCTTFYPQTPFQFNDVAVANGRLFLSLLGDPPTADNTGLYACQTTAATCKVTPMLVWPAYRDAFWLTADADNVYVRIAPQDANHGVYRCAAGGCGGVATPVLTPDIIPVLVAKLANDATAIYWSTFSDTPGERGVRRLAKQP